MRTFAFILLNILALLFTDASASNLLYPNSQSRSLNCFVNLKLPYDANIVNTIYQDNNGLVWIGTKRGLINYNGFNYHLCYFGKNLPDENTIQSIIQADDEYLYVGTDNGVRKFSLSTWKFENNEKELAAIKAVRTLAVFDDKLWIGTRDEGLFFYDLKQRKLHKISSASFRHKLVYSLLAVGDKLFIGSYGGLNIFNRVTREFTAINTSKEKATIVNSFAFDARNNCLWLGTEGKLLQYNLRNNSIIVKKEFSGTFLKNIIVDTQTNQLIIGTEIGLLTYQISTGLFEFIEHDVHNPQSLCNNLVYDLYKDAQNNLWIATDNGISMYQHSPLLQEIKLSDFINTSKGNLFTNILVGRNDDYWLGGENGLLHVTRDKTVWYNTANDYYKLRNNNVRAIYEDREKQIWIATDGGVAKLDNGTKQFVYFKIGDRQNYTNWTYGIYEDDAHRMWIATYMSGLVVINKKDLLKSSLTHYALSQKNFYGSKHIKSVYKLEADYKGNIWANTNEGLICINPSSGAYEQVGIYLDNFICDGNSIWYSDQGSIYKYDIKNKKKYKVPYQISYGSANSIVGIRNRIWISSADGISYIEKKSLNVFPCYIIDKHFKCAVYDAVNKRILFGGEDELATINVAKFDKVYRKKAAVISALYCDTVLIPIVGNRFQKNVQLPSFRNISIELASYDYSSPGEVFYYKWNNEHEWKKMKAGNNLLEYPVMPSGENILKICLTNPKVDRDAVITTYSFKVPFPWYLSIWAWMSYLLLFVGCVVALLKMQKRKNEKIFERKAKEKTMELTRMKMDFFVNVSHELKTPLSLIIAPLGKMLAESTNSKKRDTLKGIHRNALKLNSLIYKIIDDKQTEYESENQVLRSHVELISLINNCVSSFSPIIGEKNIAVGFSHQMKELWLNVDMIKIESVFTNLLSNAIKHVDDNCGEIKINLVQKDNEIMVSVRDNGRGILSEELPLIFIKHYQGKTENKENYGTGIGLYLVKKYIEMHLGKVFVSNDNGAVFTVSIPLKENSIINGELLENDFEPENSEVHLPVILIIDDNEEVVGFLCSALCEKYKCFKAYDGKEGLDVLQSHKVDLIIVDQMMPVMSGLDFVRTVKHNALTENIPIIMLTAKDDFDTEMQSIKVGVDVFLSKPFDFNKLLLQVARLIKHSQNIKKNAHIEKILSSSTSVNEENVESPDELFMRELLRCIETNMDKEGFNVSMIAELLKVDQKQLYRKIKQLAGKTPVNFLRTMRLKRAAELLKQNRFTVSEVMYMVGISNASYFTKCFAAEYGMTPKQFVQEHSS